MTSRTQYPDGATAIITTCQSDNGTWITILSRIDGPGLTAYLVDVHRDATKEQSGRRHLNIVAEIAAD